jgi:hypothetical protein
MAEAQPGEIVVSNGFYQMLDDDAQTQFAEYQPVVAKNECRHLEKLCGA